MSSDSAETVRRSRELMASGFDPVALMSQLAGLLVDIIAGTHKFSHQQYSGTTMYSLSLLIYQAQTCVFNDIYILLF